ncbi:hypothetical protein CFREI_01670 [Corynebacterium freiburgense]|nr:hypothetical protein CFREI_01670 [Corynebacterium freiburgense]
MFALPSSFSYQPQQFPFGLAKLWLTQCVKATPLSNHVSTPYATQTEDFLSLDVIAPIFDVPRSYPESKINFYFITFRVVGLVLGATDTFLGYWLVLLGA